MKRKYIVFWKLKDDKDTIPCFFSYLHVEAPDHLEAASLVEKLAGHKVVMVFSLGELKEMVKDLNSVPVKHFWPALRA